jgi:gamma-glutamylcyclotransferase (GGCT)/AIG2-like uncharacterized protein YtfP
MTATRLPHRKNHYTGRAMPNYFAVYGTLRPQGRSRRAPRLPGARHMGECLIPGRLFVSYGFPVLKPHSDTVKGDLFVMPYGFDFTPVDNFEDYYPRAPHKCWYVRRRVQLRRPRVHAWVYYYVHRLDVRTLVRSGDWVQHCRNGSSGDGSHADR